MNARFYSFEFCVFSACGYGPGDPCAEVRLLQQLEDIADENNQ